MLCTNGRNAALDERVVAVAWFDDCTLGGDRHPERCAPSLGNGDSGCRDSCHRKQRCANGLAITKW